MIILSFPFEEYYREHVPLLNKLREMNAIPVEPGHVGFGATQVKFEIKEMTKEDCEKAAEFMQEHFKKIRSYTMPNSPFSEHLSLKVEPRNDRYGSHHLVFTALSDEAQDLLLAIFNELKKK